MRTAIALVLLVAAAGCSTTTPTDTPGVERAGQTVLVYRGPEIEAAVGYRWANQNLGEEWLIVDLAVTAAQAPVEIERGDIWVRTPRGETIPLATQKEFGESFGELRPVLNRVSIVADPLDYFQAQGECGLHLFAAPGEAVTYDSVTVDDRRVCSGRLFFFVPQGTQSGPWVLGIDLPESKVRIPFRIGQED